MANGHQLDLPDSVRRQIDAFRRGLWIAETLAAIFGAIAGIFGAYLLLFLSDRIWDTPIWLRTVIALGCLASVAGWTWFWLSRWVLKKRDPRQLAMLVQRHFPKLGDRLLGIVELAHPDTRPTNVSEVLCSAAMQQVATETQNLDFSKAVSKRQERRWALAFGSLGVLAVVALIALPLAGINVWLRLNPFGSAQRYTLAKLEGLPSQKIVVYGEPFVLKAMVATNSEWVPVHASGRYAEQQPMEVAALDRTFTFNVPGQTLDGVFSVRAGDALKDVAVTPMHRPELLQLQAFVQLPDYLGYGTVTQDVRHGSVDLLANSKFTMAGKTSRELKSVTDGDATGTVNGINFTVPEREVKVPATTTLQWEDVHELRAKEPFKLKLNVVDDEPPSVDFRDLQHIVAMLEDETLEFEAVATDDYGVRVVAISWSGPGSESAGGQPTKGEQIIAQGGQQLKEVSGKVYFSPSALQITPQRIELHAVANDYKPDREPVESPPYYIIILDKTEHAKLVQREFDRLVEKLEELARTEQSLLERNEQLRRDIATSQNPQEQAERLAEQEQAERRNTSDMQKLAEDLAKLAKEALRNSQIPEDVVGKWAQLVEQLSKIGQGGMPKISKSLSQAQGSPSKGEQQNNMNDALEQQAEVVKQMAEALKQMNQSGEMMQAGNFVARLRKMAALEKSVSEEMGKLYPQLIGATVDQIPVSVRIKVQRVGDQQYQAQEGVKTIRDEMGSFVMRTQQERYKRVHQDMLDTKVVEDLERLTDLLDKKISQEGIEGSKQWALKLGQWATLLEPPKSDSGGGGGGGGGGGQQTPPEVLAAIMKLMRIRLGEEDLRNHTRAIDTRRQAESYAKHAAELSDQQSEFRTEVAEAGEVLKESKGVPEALAKVDGAMKDASALLARPQTDLETIAAETEVIEVLTDLLDKASKGKGGNASGMAQMMQAMQRMGQGSQTGKTPGGNTSGGITEREATPGTGNPTGNTAGHRNVDKGSGPDLNKVPAEFRDALQAYYEKVDKL